ncbi:PREDICTED: ZAR1-like protein [Myotis brandtii]|uniref:ZAR1-like protein n=1 Tax=Myotis brandtii TaxID=109478 RepID=UPI0003BB9D86|nr:PREDICTED: ZAR1-like protein [Myotis brandtii]
MKVEGRIRTQANYTRIYCAKPGQQMERFVRVPQGLYQGTHYGNTLPLGQPGLSDHQQPDWSQNTGAPTFLARTGLVVPTNAWAYCTDPYKRAQLKAILSQMNPSLGLRLCKANTKEAGVQVSLRVDRSVQCSLGPLTLRSCSFWGCRGPKAPLPAWDLYSPAMDLRDLIRLRKDGKDEEWDALSSPAEESQQQQQQKSSPLPTSQEDKQAELWQQGKLEEDASSPGRSKQAQGDAHPLRKPNFQFLERKYAYFHCKDCKTRWESAYVWCISGTSKVYFKQLCCKCHKSFNPYRVEAIQCQTCLKSRCSCPLKKRNIDLRRPHRQELCGRCKDKRFSCGNIYSIKYIM